MDKPCLHCGITTIPAHSKYEYLCCECGKIYSQYSNFKCTKCRTPFNVGTKEHDKLAWYTEHYTKLAKHGFRVPKEFRISVDYAAEYKKHLDSLDYNV